MKAILVVNCGSSSLKFALYALSGDDALEKRASGLVEGIGTAQGRFKAKGSLGEAETVLENPSHLSGFGALKSWLEGAGVRDDEILGVGHRVVQGGAVFSESVVLDDAKIDQVDELAAMAPLHNHAHALGMREAKKAWPNAVQAAVFDTAFHQTMPPKAYRFAVPSELYEKHALRKYGFHGTSHRYVSARTAEILGRPVESIRMVTAHLGNGCSCCAILGGKCVDTTMGLTPLDGLMMGTRSGATDPSVFDYLERKLGWSASKTVQVLNKESGLLGISGLSQDMRTLVAARAEGHEGAKLAIEMFEYRLAKTIASLTIPLGGLDALVFAGGIGENSYVVRGEAVRMLAPLGLELDEEANAKAVGGAEGKISVGDSPVALVVPTDEELLIAKDTLALARGRK